jgi:antitoxin (DNA-binding transcriptional repressor) of toxin-antitoxin stability system
VLERVRKTGKPLRITRFGKPIAEIVPPQPEVPKRRVLGQLRGMAVQVGDIVVPSTDLVQWDALKPGPKLKLDRRRKR